MIQKKIKILILSLVGILSACANSNNEIIKLGPQAQTEDQAFAIEEIKKVGERFFAGAPEKLFSKGAEGLGTAIEKIFSRFGRPNAYITGTEGSGSLVVGLRMGQGELSHKLEGTQPVYWIGPSIGFDAGGNVARTFTLIYNLYDTNELYQRFPSAEGSAFFIGGISINYQQNDNVIIVPIRMGLGVRLGVNTGWVKYRKKKTYSPF